MVEFPLVARRSARGFAAPVRFLSQLPRFADINFASSNRALSQAGMWETSTFAASFHARLNVALRGHFRTKAALSPPFRPLQIVTNFAARWPASGSGPIAFRRARALP